MNRLDNNIEANRIANTIASFNNETHDLFYVNDGKLQRWQNTGLASVIQRFFLWLGCTFSIKKFTTKLLSDVQEHGLALRADPNQETLQLKLAGLYYRLIKKQNKTENSEAAQRVQQSYNLLCGVDLNTPVPRPVQGGAPAREGAQVPSPAPIQALRNAAADLPRVFTIAQTLQLDQIVREYALTAPQRAQLENVFHTLPRNSDERTIVLAWTEAAKGFALARNQAHWQGMVAQLEPKYACLNIRPEELPAALLKEKTVEAFTLEVTRWLDGELLKETRKDNFLSQFIVADFFRVTGIQGQEFEVNRSQFLDDNYMSTGQALVIQFASEKTKTLFPIHNDPIDMSARLQAIIVRAHTDSAEVLGVEYNQVAYELLKGRFEEHTRASLGAQGKDVNQWGSVFDTAMKEYLKQMNFRRQQLGVEEAQFENIANGTQNLFPYFSVVPFKTVIEDASKNPFRRFMSGGYAKVVKKIPNPDAPTQGWFSRFRAGLTSH